jgi:hypothetical protein
MSRLLLVITIFGTATATAAAPGPGCAPILSAMAKTLQVDHATLTQSNGQTTRGITAGGVNYVQIDSAWKVSPFSPKDNQARSDENLRNAQSYTCQSMPDSSVDGVAVANYRTRTQSDGTAVESKISISKASGLAIQVENELDSGGSIKSHYITHYSYAGIHAPGVQN